MILYSRILDNEYNLGSDTYMCTFAKRKWALRLFMSLSKLWEIVKDKEAWRSWGCRVRHNLVTEQQQQKVLQIHRRHCC